ncbi:apolipoprotein N-acyltransferase [Leucobacter allii]|uniref:Apolipoprotein N-acyltransferase n=1 Tax=Leucobacter allii TaxID=2932247 RepID=A0ABY4FQI6_9MICO|nr:apolipoprotein N-acyltransferase [Leucobacter allii]UOQ58449.1 apolipoprotein N-acyltransferase [Leucobacter allii]
MTAEAGPEPARLRWWAAVPLAAAGGLLLDVASPELAWWAAAFPGTALVLAAVWQQRAGVAALAGLAAGCGFWLPHISWLTLYLGPVPWLGLSAVMVLWYALFGIAAALATRGLARLPLLAARPALRLAAQAVTTAGLWVVREQLQGAWPYGGFPWGRLAHTQADGPLLEAVSWLGFAGLSGAIAFACALPIAALFAGGAAALARLVRRGEARPAARRIGAPLAAAVALLLLLGALPASPLPEHGSLRVAAVQGNSKSGIFDDRDSGDVLEDHLAATAELLDALEAGDERVDLIVWPENSAEFGLPDNPLGATRIARLAERAGAPIVLGSVLRDPDGSYTNSTLVWGPEGETEARYDKIYPVPFAEYMPNRDFFHMLAPDLVDLVQLDYRPGTRPSVIDVETADGPLRAGIAICFDIIFDAQAVDLVDRDAELILAQTNNADFGRTDENAQQLAIARLRAVETGRALVNISTVGTSAVVAPDGADLAAIAPYAAGAMTAEVPRVSGATPALAWGAAIAAGWMLLGAIGLACGVAGRPRATRRSVSEARVPAER